jgi:hypothetical protein
VLLAAGIVENFPSLTKDGQLTIRYKISDIPGEFHAAIKNNMRYFSS